MSKARATTSRDVARQSRDQQEVDDALLSISHDVSREAAAGWSPIAEDVDEKTQPYSV